MLFSKKPTTVTEIFDNAVKEAKGVQEAQVKLSEKLVKEQEAREKAFKENQKKLTDAFNAKIAANQKLFDAETSGNKESVEAATAEIKLADNLMVKYSEFFGIEVKDA